jgi:hypothetical protein
MVTVLGKNIPAGAVTTCAGDLVGNCLSGKSLVKGDLSVALIIALGLGERDFDLDRDLDLRGLSISLGDRFLSAADLSCVRGVRLLFLFSDSESLLLLLESAVDDLDLLLSGFFSSGLPLPGDFCGDLDLGLPLTGDFCCDLGEGRRLLQGCEGGPCVGGIWIWDKSVSMGFTRSTGCCRPWTRSRGCRLGS